MQLIGFQPGETYIVGVEYNGSVTVTQPPVMTAQIADGEEFTVPYDGVETASLEKTQNLAVSSRANGQVTTILKYKHIIQDGEVGEFKIKSYTGGELYTEKGKRITVSTLPTISEEEKVLIPEPAESTLALYSQIGAANYGQDVNYEVTSNNVTISDWKIFCKEGNVVTIIANDVITNSAIPSGTEVIKGTGTEEEPCLYRVYWLRQSDDYIGRTNALNKLLGAYKSGNADIWKDFVRSDLTGKATAMGGVTLTTFVNSWNNYPGQEQTIAICGDETNTTGVAIGSTASANDYISANNISTTNKANDLYYPRKESFQDGTAYESAGISGYSHDGKCCGYWLVTPYSSNTTIVSVSYGGDIGYNGYMHAHYGVRPAVRLTSDVKGEYKNGKWSIK